MYRTAPSAIMAAMASHPPDADEAIVRGREVAFVDAESLGESDLIASIERVVGRLDPGAVITVHSVRPDAVGVIERWCAAPDGAEVELITSFPEGFGSTIALRLASRSEPGSDRDGSD